MLKHLLIGLSVTAFAVPAFAFSPKQKPAPDASSASSGVSNASIWVTRPDGAQSCSPGSGQSVEDGANELKKNKVRVLESRKGNDGKMHAMGCGMPSGSTNAYLIPRDDLPQAVAKGFVEAK
jgi:hypothetical protein